MKPVAIPESLAVAPLSSKTGELSAVEAADVPELVVEEATESISTENVGLCSGANPSPETLLETELSTDAELPPEELMKPVAIPESLTDFVC